MTSETPVTDGGTASATAAGSQPPDTPSPGEDPTGPSVSFPFQQEQTETEQPGLNDFLDLTPVDDPEQDVIGPVTSNEQKHHEFSFARPGCRIRINSVYTGTIIEVLDMREYRTSDHGFFKGVCHTNSREKIYCIDVDTAWAEELHVKVKFGYSSTLREAEYIHANLDTPVDITQVHVSNHSLPDAVDTHLYHTLKALTGDRVFYKTKRGEIQIVEVLDARAGHIKFNTHTSVHASPSWAFIASDPTDTPAGPGYLGSARATTSLDWGLTPSVSGDSGPISVLDIGYTPTGLEYPSELHADDGHLSTVFEDLHREPTDQSESMVTDLSTLTGVDHDHPDPEDTIDAVTGVGAATAHKLSGLGERKTRPSKATLRDRLEAAETVEITEGDPDVAAKLQALQAERDTQPTSEDASVEDQLITVVSVLEGGPELHQISGQYRAQTMADIRNALDGADRFDVDAAFRLFTATTNGMMYSPNGLKMGSLVQLHLGNVDMEETAFVGAPTGDGDTLDFTTPDSSLGQCPAVFLSRTSLAETAPILYRAWKASPTHRLSDLPQPAAQVVDQLTDSRTDEDDPVVPDPVPVTGVEPHLTDDKIGLTTQNLTPESNDGEESPADSGDVEREWVSVPSVFAEFVAGLLGINILETPPEDLRFQVYQTGAIELKHPHLDLWVTVTT